MFYVVANLKKKVFTKNKKNMIIGLPQSKWTTYIFPTDIKASFDYAVIVWTPIKCHASSLHNTVCKLLCNVYCATLKPKQQVNFGYVITFHMLRGKFSEGMSWVNWIMRFGAESNCGITQNAFSTIITTISSSKFIEHKQTANLFC